MEQIPSIVVLFRHSPAKVETWRRLGRRRTQLILLFRSRRSVAINGHQSCCRPFQRCPRVAVDVNFCLSNSATVFRVGFTNQGPFSWKRIFAVDVAECWLWLRALLRTGNTYIGSIALPRYPSLSRSYLPLGPARPIKSHKDIVEILFFRPKERSLSMGIEVFLLSLHIQREILHRPRMKEHGTSKKWHEKI